MKRSPWKGLFFLFNILGIILTIIGILIATLTLNGFITLANESYILRFFWGFMEIWVKLIFFLTKIVPLSLDLAAIILCVDAAISIIGLILLLDFSQIHGWRFRFLIFSGIFNVVLICIGLGLFDTVLINGKINWLLETFFLIPLSSLNGSIPLIIGAILTGINIYIFFGIKNKKYY